MRVFTRKEKPLREHSTAKHWCDMEQFAVPSTGTPELTYLRSRAKSYTLDYTTTSDTICLVFGRIVTQIQYDDEPPKPLVFHPETAAFHPRGCRLRVAATNVSEGFFAFSYAESFKDGSSCHKIAPQQRTRNCENINAEGVRHLIRYARSRLMAVVAPDPWEAQCLSTLIYGEIAKALNRASSRRQGRLTDAGFARLESYIRDHIDSTITCEDLAQELGLPLRSLFDAVKARTGQSLYRFVVERRLDAAMRLLQETEMSICEVAAASGFASQQHMTTLFSQRRGTTPRRARASRNW